MYGVFAPGTQLGEAELAARFEVSRGPLREAMQRLVQEGLLRGERHRGLFVIDLSASDVRDIYLARLAIERTACQLIMAGEPGGGGGGGAGGGFGPGGPGPRGGREPGEG